VATTSRRNLGSPHNPAFRAAHRHHPISPRPIFRAMALSTTTDQPFGVMVPTTVPSRLNTPSSPAWIVQVTLPLGLFLDYGAADAAPAPRLITPARAAAPTPNRVSFLTRFLSVGGNPSYPAPGFTEACANARYRMNGGPPTRRLASDKPRRGLFGAATNGVRLERWVGNTRDLPVTPGSGGLWPLTPYCDDGVATNIVSTILRELHDRRRPAFFTFAVRLFGPPFAAPSNRPYPPKVSVQCVGATLAAAAP
jgi:hypothetical protein